MRALRLFDEATLRKLERLTLNAVDVRVGALKGDRHSRKRGTSIEFADYRNYAQGDDLRRLDWNIFARLDRPFIKLTEEEEDLAVHILVDTSASMEWPLPSPVQPGMDGVDTNKLRYGLRIAGGLGYVGLSSGDLVTVALFDSQGQRSWGPFRGRRNGWPMLQFLESNYVALRQTRTETPRTTELDISLRDYALRIRRPGLLILISDLFSPGGYRDGLRALQARGYDIVVLHVLSPDEAAPNIGGDLKLVDIETGKEAEVSVDETLLELYVERRERWQSEIRQHCVARDIHYSPVITDYPWDAMITRALREQGVIR